MSVSISADNPGPKKSCCRIAEFLKSIPASRWKKAETRTARLKPTTKGPGEAFRTQVANSGEKIAPLRKRPVQHSWNAGRNLLAAGLSRVIAHHFQAEHSADPAHREFCIAAHRPGCPCRRCESEAAPHRQSRRSEWCVPDSNCARAVPSQLTQRRPMRCRLLHGVMKIVS